MKQFTTFNATRLALALQVIRDGSWLADYLPNSGITGQLIDDDTIITQNTSPNSSEYSDDDRVRLMFSDGSIMELQLTLVREPDSVRKSTHFKALQEAKKEARGY